MIKFGVKVTDWLIGNPAGEAHMQNELMVPFCEVQYIKSNWVLSSRCSDNKRTTLINRMRALFSLRDNGQSHDKLCGGVGNSSVSVKRENCFRIIIRLSSSSSSVQGGGTVCPMVWRWDLLRRCLSREAREFGCAQLGGAVKRRARFGTDAEAASIVWEAALTSGVDGGAVEAMATSGVDGGARHASGGLFDSVAKFVGVPMLD